MLVCLHLPGYIQFDAQAQERKTDIFFTQNMVSQSKLGKQGIQWINQEVCKCEVWSALFYSSASQLVAWLK